MVCGHFLDDKDFEELRKYQYKGGGTTTLDIYMNEFWNWLAEFIPKNIAPNILTLTALLCSFCCCFVVVYTTPDMTGVPPAWALVASAVFFFLYQTLDALDGKQARNTKSSSPLGQLFDHGCDSLTATLIAVTTCTYLGVGNSFWTFISVLGVQLPVLVLNWNEIHSHVFLTATGELGVTEGQFLSMGIALQIAIFGRSFWEMDLLAIPAALQPILDTPMLQPRHIVCFVFFLGAVDMMRTTIPAGIRNAIDKALAIKQTLSFAVWLIATAAVFYSGLYARFGIIAWAMWAVVFSAYATRLVISATVKKYFAPLQWVLVPFYVMSCALYFIKAANLENLFSIPICPSCTWIKFALRGTTITDSLLLPDIIFLAHCVYILLYFQHFVRTTISDICKAVGIYAFTLKRRPIQLTVSGNDKKTQ